MAPKRVSKNEESMKKTTNDVLSKVFAKMNKTPAPVKSTKKRRKTFIRKIGDLPNSDDGFDNSSDSDYEPSDKKIRTYSDEIVSKTPQRKTSAVTRRPKLNNVLNADEKSRRPLALSKKNLKRLLIDLSSDDENTPSTSTKKTRNASKKLLPPQQHQQQGFSKIIKFPTNISGQTSDDAGSTASSRVASFSSLSRRSSTKCVGNYLSTKSFKSLKRPSLKRFRSSSSSENLESLANAATTVAELVAPVKRRSSVEKVFPYVGDNSWGERIPVEVLSSVFRFGMSADGGAVPFLLKMQLVCRLWRNVARTPLLWTDIDFDYQNKIKDSKAALAYLSNYMGFVHSLSLSRWSKLKVADLDNLLQCNRSNSVRNLDVSFCSSLLPKQLLEQSLSNYCPNLQSLNLSYFSPVNNALTNALTNYLLSDGQNLRCLYLNGNTVQRFHKFWETFKSKPLKSLQVLDISRLVCQTVQSSKSNILDFCNALPNLTHLYMSDSIFGLNPTVSEEDLENCEEIWPNLVHVEFAVKEPWWGFLNNFQTLIKCLQKCTSLRSLCISGHRVDQNLNLLAHIPLTELNISRTSQIDLSIGSTMKKWAPTLEALDISWIKCCEVFPEICKLLTPTGSAPPPPLRRLNVAGTPITVERLRSVILACPHLEYLDCSSCRSLPLGMKRAYDATEIRSLINKL